MSTSAPVRITAAKIETASAAARKPIIPFLIWAGLALMGGAVIGTLLNVVVVLNGGSWSGFYIQAAMIFSMTVAVAAQVSSRYTLVIYAQSHALVRYGVILATLVGAAVAATAASIGLRPGILVVRGAPFFLALVILNVVLSVLIGGALIGWDTMKRSLERALGELRVKEAFEREMRLARDVQEELLPKAPPDLAGYAIAFSNRQAALVGGDMLDFIPLPGGEWGVAVGDVSGKGLAAALMMANLQAQLRAVAGVDPEPARLNERVSDLLATRGQSGRFVTLAYLVLEPHSGRLRYSLAGHHPPILAGPSRLRMLEAGGLPLGLYGGANYEQDSDELAPGETLVVYTDGLVEAPAGNNPERQFGKDRLLDVVRDHHAQGPEPLLNALQQALETHLSGGDIGDDTTILILQRSSRVEELEGDADV